MSRVCEMCGKKTMYGNRVTTRGLPKRVGGIGLKTTGIVRRTYKPNLQRVRAVVNGSVRRPKYDDIQPELTGRPAGYTRSLKFCVISTLSSAPSWASLLSS